jgi:lysylphosphatidylglycerol synthetase-like protein (DUF2156 family)
MQPLQIRKEKNSIAELVQCWGHATSIALLDPQCQIFSIPSLHGAIGYKFHGNSAVVFGNPVCASHDIPQLTQAFHEFCKKKRKKVIYVATSPSFTNWILQHFCTSALGIGHEIILNPQIDPKTYKGADASNLRNKWNLSRRLGIVVQEYKTYDQELEKQLDEVKNHWLQGRKGPQIFIFSNIDLFSDRTHKRIFYATYNDTIVGILLLNRLDGGNGVVINMLMVSPHAPNPTSEFLVMSTLDILRTEGCTFFSVGTTPATQLGEVKGFGRVSTWIARHAYQTARKIFNLNNRQRYWKKFQPQLQSSYLVFSSSRIGLCDIVSIMRAFNAHLSPK